jgi:hypothetical protein
MLADEITDDLRAIRAQAIAQAKTSGQTVTRALVSKGINYGAITARTDGSVDTTAVDGVNPDLRVRPFFAHGGKISIREFVMGAVQAEMGLQAVDPELMAAHQGGRFVTPSGMVLDGALDQIEAPPTSDPTADPDGDGVQNEIPVSIVDHFEFYLLNYFKPGRYAPPGSGAVNFIGQQLFQQIKCATCHIPNLQINHDRRVADGDTVFDSTRGVFNGLFATATGLFNTTPDNSGLPPLKQPKLQPFLVKNIFTDFKRQDLGPNFYERNYDGTSRTEFLTTPLQAGRQHASVWA